MQNKNVTEFENRLRAEKPKLSVERKADGAKD